MADIWFDVDTAIGEAPINILPLIDDTDFKSIEAAVAYNAAGLALFWNFVTTAGAQTCTAVTPTSGGDYDWTDQGTSGMYAIEIPASGGASINNDTEGFGWFTGVATGVLPWRGPVIGFRAAALNNSLIDAGTTGLLAPTTAARTLNVSAGGVADADTVAISTDSAAADALETMLDGTGGNVLSLKQLNCVNSTGSAIVASSTGSNGHGIAASGNGSGEGLSATGGATGSGIEAIGGATSGEGIKAVATAGTSSQGIYAIGFGLGAGLSVTGGASGSGMFAQGGSSDGNAITAQGGGNGSGAALLGNGAGNGVGLYVRGTGTLGHGLMASSAGTGSGIHATGGDTSGNAITATATAGNGHGLIATGQGSGEGLRAVGGATGNGIEGVGGGTSGDGINANAAGSGLDINAPNSDIGIAVIADGVWDEQLSGHTTAGSAGKALSDAGSSGDPWGTALPGAYASGTAGHIVGTALPDIAPGSANGLLRGGTNAATSITTALTANLIGNITGNLSGSVGSVTGAVGSVTGAVGSVTGNVGGNVTGSVGSVVGAVGSVTAAVTVGTNNDKTGYRLSATGVDDVWDDAVDGSVTARQSLRLANSANGAITAGGATTTFTIRDLADTKDRVTATVDANGDRSAVTRDLT